MKRRPMMMTDIWIHIFVWILKSSVLFWYYESAILKSYDKQLSSSNGNSQRQINFFFVNPPKVTPSPTTTNNNQWYLLYSFLKSLFSSTCQIWTINLSYIFVMYVCMWISNGDNFILKKRRNKKTITIIILSNKWSLWSIESLLWIFVLVCFFQWKVHVLSRLHHWLI